MDHPFLMFCVFTSLLIDNMIDNMSNICHLLLLLSSNLGCSFLILRLEMLLFNVVADNIVVSVVVVVVPVMLLLVWLFLSYW